MTAKMVIELGGYAIGLFAWVFWFLAYRDAARRALEADELLTSLAIKIVAQDVAGAVPIAQKIVKRAGLYVAPKKGPPQGAA